MPFLYPSLECVPLPNKIRLQTCFVITPLKMESPHSNTGRSEFYSQVVYLEVSINRLQFSRQDCSSLDQICFEDFSQSRKSLMLETVHYQEEPVPLVGNSAQDRVGMGLFSFFFPIPFPNQGPADRKPFRSQAAAGGRAAGPAASVGNFPASLVDCATPG